jgi:hypothetical protein
LSRTRFEGWKTDFEVVDFTFWLTKGSFTA